MSKPPSATWESLRRQNAAAAAPAHDTPEEMVLRATTGPDGYALMEWLRQEYIERRNGPMATESALREAEACRGLVDRLEKMRLRGIEIAASRNKTV